MLEVIYKSERYVTPSVTYQEPKYYIDSFSDVVPHGTLYAEAQNPIVVTGLDGQEHTAYPRYKIETRTETIEIAGKEYQHVIGMLVALDLQKPTIKIYSGLNTSSCLNLSVFNAEDIYEEGLLNQSVRAFEYAKKFSNDAVPRISDYTEIFEMLTNKQIERRYVSNMLGSMLLDASKKSSRIPTSAIVGASKLFCDKKTSYYFDAETSGLNVLGALTQPITDSPDIMTKPQKTLAICQYIRKELLN